MGKEGSLDGAFIAKTTGRTVVRRRAHLREGKEDLENLDRRQRGPSVDRATNVLEK